MVSSYISKEGQTSMDLLQYAKEKGIIDFDLPKGTDARALQSFYDKFVKMATEAGRQGHVRADSGSVNAPATVAPGVVLQENRTSRSCLAKMCSHIGVQIDDNCVVPADIDHTDLVKLRNSDKCKVGYTMYSSDDVRNHVVPVAATKSATVDFTVDGGDGSDNCTHGITSPQEFFNPGGRFHRVKFYADTLEGTGFGADAAGSTADKGRAPNAAATTGGSNRYSDRAYKGAEDYPLPPASIAGFDVESGSANVTGGVVRSKKRNIRAISSYDKNTAALRNYAVAGTTMFNNLGELYLNTISREYAQEVLEDLFQAWGVPSDDPEAMRYAEDLVFAFLVARTASNKAEYSVAYDIPAKEGPVEADFSKLSVILADKYGLTRRNFSRGLADDLRDYLDRPENQAIKSRSAARIGADPQYGHLCFDGSTECSNLTTSQQKFTKVLEAKGLYESDAVLADGASATLMEGIHGGTRSNVSR